MHVFDVGRRTVFLYHRVKVLISVILFQGKLSFEILKLKAAKDLNS